MRLEVFYKLPRTHFSDWLFKVEPDIKLVIVTTGVEVPELNAKSRGSPLYAYYWGYLPGVPIPGFHNDLSGSPVQRGSRSVSEKKPLM